jgi:hypothetical protein
MKRFITLLLVLSLFKIGSAYAATPANTNDNSRIIFGTTKAKTANVNQVLALLVGPQGRIGPVGLTGPRGFQGINGQDGLPGAPGPAGATGATGATGASGPAGPAGPAGPKGDDGAPGTGGGGGGFGQGTVSLDACDNSISMGFTSFFSAGTFSLNSITISDLAAACSGKTLNLFFTMNAASSGSFGPYSVGDTVKCTGAYTFTVPSGQTSTQITISNTQIACTNTTTSVSFGSDLRKIGARDFASVVGVEFLSV